MTRVLSSRFSPRSLEPAQLERLTVGREQLLAHLQRVVTDAVVSGQGRFDLLVGPRGAGKSHCIGLLDARLRASPQLVGRAIVVAPPEELHPTSLVSLLAAFLREFPDDPDAGPAADALRSLQRAQDGNREQRAVELIRARLGGRSLILLLENLDELFEMLGREGQQRLRNILQTQRRWSIVASSRSVSPSFVKHEAPFHGTFNQHLLEPLSAEQCREMLAALADAHGKIELAALLRTNTGLGRVRGIHHLLGGNPRAMAFMFRQLDEHRLDHFELALANLADDIKPYFQEQMTRLSPAQRGVMELLAESWRPLTVNELAERGFTSQASTSGALRHLRRDRLVQVNIVGREHLYEIGDPLHRLARANERPREAIEAFARVIRWWYADDTMSDYKLRKRFVLPEAARTASVAADVAADVVISPAYLAHARALHALAPADAVTQARAELAKRESPGTRAALVLALERLGDEQAAVEALLSALGPHAEAISAYVIGLAASEPPLESNIAGALRHVLAASVKRPTQEDRTRLLQHLEQASPPIVRLLSDHVAHSALMMRWLIATAYEDLGALLGRIRPTRSSPTLEWVIPGVLYSAWHFDRLTSLLSAAGRQLPALAVLPQQLREVVEVGLGLQNQPVPDFSEFRSSSNTNHLALILAMSLLLERLSSSTEDPTEGEGSEELMAAIASELRVGVYAWIASRRSPRRLRGVAALLPDLAEWLPLLACNTAREAVARMSEAERTLMREFLDSLDDQAGLAELGLAPTSAASAAPPSRG